MKASELIIELQKAIAEHGNMDVCAPDVLERPWSINALRYDRDHECMSLQLD